MLCVGSTGCTEQLTMHENNIDALCEVYNIVRHKSITQIIIDFQSYKQNTISNIYCFYLNKLQSTRSMRLSPRLGASCKQSK